MVTILLFDNRIHEIYADVDCRLDGCILKDRWYRIIFTDSNLKCINFRDHIFLLANGQCE